MPHEPPQPEDEEARRWTAGIAAGDHNALAEFYNAWFESSVKIVGAFTGCDEAFCLDVVQSVMLKATAKITPMNDARSLRAWMVRLLRNESIDALRARQRRIRHEAAAARSENRADESLAERIEWLSQMLAQADPDLRALLALRFVHGASLADTGQAMSKSTGATHGVIRRVLAAWRQHWQTREEES